jgi:hypothetical protein
MDVITLGTAVGLTVVTQLTKKLMEKAADPEIVAKGVNWVFGSVDHFLKIRKGEKSKDEPIQSPPDSAPPTESLVEIDDIAVEDKTEAVQEIAKSLEREVSSPDKGGVYLNEMDEFALEQLTREVESLINQLEIYLRNLRFEEEKAAQFGGLTFAPPIVMNTIRIQQEEIAKRVWRLNKAMQQAYGVAAPNLDALVRATSDRG